MAHQSNHGSCSPAIVRLMVVLVGVWLVGYTMAPPLYRHLTGKSNAEASCRPCICDCSSESFLSIPLGLSKGSFQDCGSHDPDIKEEVEKSVTDLLAEELRLQEDVKDDHEKYVEASIREAKKTSSHYQKESEKCNAGVETCEEARERAEAALRDELKISALWEKRAHKRGWIDKRRSTY